MFFQILGAIAEFEHWQAAHIAGHLRALKDREQATTAAHDAIRGKGNGHTS